MVSKDDFVLHKMFGEGSVRSVDGDTVIVRFESGLQECQHNDLARLEKLEEKLGEGKQDSPLAVVTRTMGACIRSINDEWGVFSSSRIKLFPHQLWVCKQVLTEWPSRWLVADDVGLGKTVEAGLILTSLISAKKINRVLIIAPASLAEQWQERMRTMFDIRFSLYASTNDREKSDYWNTHPFVIVSLHTIRNDSNNRWERITDSNPWDLVIVDEAHHLNADEQSGKTLALQLLTEMEEKHCLNSLLLFTGTPHRGKDYGFMSLLTLLRPNEFSPKQSIEEVFEKLNSVMIRNNKQKVTDMDGNLIFTPVTTHKEFYSYSEEERVFYDRLTEFILSGRTYASTLSHQQSRIVMFILTAMQKLASSSVSAIQKAIKKRIEKIRNKNQQSTVRLEQLFNSNFDDDNYSSMTENDIFEEGGSYHLLPEDEINALEELLELSKNIEEETKILKILDVIENKYPSQSILFFTEYKATQALLVSILREKYGASSTTFINGDGYLDFVNNKGEISREKTVRTTAAEKFNSGKVSFLISTEAAGEGIDLQSLCNTLIHVDTPWNPMRLHQRVGRLSRLGQTKPVDVILFHNPDTIEARIFNCLEQKLERITLAFQGVMDDPEDMCSLVIGMQSSSVFDSIFSNAYSEKSTNLESWFNQKTSTFGGEDVIDLTKKMFGSAKKFDFGSNIQALPKVDLEDLVPFMKLSLTHAGRRYQEYDSNRLSFQTPKKWKEDDHRIFSDYELVFSRSVECADEEEIGGVGLCVVNKAVEEATSLSESVATIKKLQNTILVFRLRDRLTGGNTTVLQSIVGAKRKGDVWQILRDWELLLELNQLADKPLSLQRESNTVSVLSKEDIEQAKSATLSFISDLSFPFRMPYIEEIACLLSEGHDPTPKSVSNICMNFR